MANLNREQRRIKADLEAVLEEARKFTSVDSLYAHIQNNPDYRKSLVSLSKRFLDLQLSGCISCYIDALSRLARLDNKFINAKLRLTHRLREGTILYLDGMPVTNYNLTNEKAKRLLEDPENAQWFIK